MDSYLWITMSGANSALSAQAVTANNLANADTTGFRAEMEATRALPVVGGGLATRAYSAPETPGADFSSGAVTRTGRPLDVAVNGTGWIVVQGPDGKPALTRNGNLTVSASGLLETADGHPVLNAARTPITVPPMSSLQIGADGTVSGVPQGADAAAPVTLGRIGLVDPAPRGLFRGPAGLFHSRAPLVPDARVTLTPRALEGSNVNTVGEMMNLIQESRSFETQIRLAHANQSAAQTDANILQI